MTRGSSFFPTLPTLRGGRHRLALAGLCLALAAGVPEPAGAQDSRQLRTIMDRLERLQGELNDLQRTVYRGEGAAAPRSGSGDEPGEAGPEQARASGATEPLTQAAGRRMRERIGGLERDLRRLTGQVQETQHQLDQTVQRLDKLVQDIEYRLQQLETFKRETTERLDRLAGDTGAGASADAGGGAEPAGDSGDGARTAQAEGAGAGTDASDSGGGDDSAGGATADGTQKLGTVSQSAVAKLRQEAEKARRAAQSDGGGDGDAADAQTAAASPGSAELPDAAPGEQYDAAFKLLQDRKYGEAEAALRAFLEKHPEHRLAGNAKYWLGETFYVREKYNQAAVIFAEGFRNYPDSRKAPDNLLKLGITLAEIDKVDKACRLFSELQTRFPDAPQNIRHRAEREQERLDCAD